VLPGRRHEHEAHRHPGRLHALPDTLGDGPDAGPVEARVLDQDPHLVVRGPVAEVRQRVEGDVAVEAADIEGGRGPDLVGEAGDAQGVERPVDGLDLHLTGRGDVGQGEARALQQHLPAGRRPGGAGLRRHEVEPLVLEVGDRGQLELAV